jgi:hypothetical protein
VEECLYIYVEMRQPAKHRAVTIEC